jgi:hypothetical protein
MEEATGPQIADFNFIEWQELYEVEKPFEIFMQLPSGYGPADRTNLVFKQHKGNLVHDMRGVERQFVLDEHGFQIMDRPTSFRLWNDREAVELVYARECAGVLKQALDDVDWIYFYNWRVSSP